MTGLLKQIFADLPSFVSPLANADVMPVVQDTATTPETRKMTYGELVTELSDIFAGASRNLFLENTASDISGYKSLTITVPSGGEVNDSASISAADTVINEYAAIANVFTFIGAQVIHVHLHIAQTAGTKTSTAYVKIFHRTSGGTETLMGTSAVSTTLTGVSTAYDFDVSVADTVFSSTDRIVLKVYASPAGGGSTPTVNVYFQGTNNSRIGFEGTPGAAATAVRRYMYIRAVAATTDWSADGSTAVGGDSRIPINGTLKDIWAYSDTAGTTGTAIVDVNLNGATIMTTNKLKWDSTEKATRTYSGTAPALTTTAVAVNDIITIDIDTNHTTKSKGLTVVLEME